MDIKLTREDKIEIFEDAMSWIIVFAMFVYGFSKFIQFNDAIRINKNISELTGMELMWAFYGYSKPFAFVLGLFEVFGGLLILIKKTRIIGCVFTSTILINIIIQDIFFEVNVGALKAAILYQLVIIFILWMNKKKVMDCVKVLIRKNSFNSNSNKLFVKLFLTFIIFITFRIVEYYFTRE